MAFHNKRGSDGRFIKKDEKGGKSYSPPKDDLITLVVYVGDQSGSMSSQRNAVVSGHGEYINGLKQKEATESQVLYTEYLFDSGHVMRIENRYTLTPIEHVTPLSYYTYNPAGGTPLNDAIAHAINETDRLIRERGIKVSRILFVIQTDGQENSSTKYDLPAVNRLRAEKEATGFWTFVMLGSQSTLYQDAASY